MKKLFYFQAIHLADPEQQTLSVISLLTQKRERRDNVEKR